MKFISLHWGAITGLSSQRVNINSVKIKRIAVDIIGFIGFYSIGWFFAERFANEQMQEYYKQAHWQPQVLLGPENERSRKKGGTQTTNNINTTIFGNCEKKVA